MAKNFSYSTVLTAPSPATSGTSLVVQSGEGANFSATPFPATIWPVGVQPTVANAEIVLVTAIATDTFTIVRAQEGSSARTVVVGDQIAATATAELVPTMGVLMDKTATDRNYAVLPSSDFMALDTLEVGSAYTVEVPSTSTLEIYSPPIKAAGTINPYKFSAYRSTGTQTVNIGSATVTWDAEEFDNNNNFTSNTYTVPVAGFYFFTASIGYNAVASGTRMHISILKNAVAVRKGDDRFTSAAVGTAVVTGFLSCAAGDAIIIQATAVGANTVINGNDTNPGNNFFTGHLVCQA